MFPGEIKKPPKKKKTQEKPYLYEHYLKVTLTWRVHHLSDILLEG